MRRKNPLKWPSAILCRTCLIQRITAQYAPLIPLALCTTSISHHIYLVFFFFIKGLTQIPQCSDTLPMLLGFRSHPFFSTAQPHKPARTETSSAARHGVNSSLSQYEFMSNCKAFKQYQLFNIRIDFYFFLLFRSSGLQLKCADTTSLCREVVGRNRHTNRMF